VRTGYNILDKSRKLVRARYSRKFSYMICKCVSVANRLSGKMYLEKIVECATRGRTSSDIFVSHGHNPAWSHHKLRRMGTDRGGGVGRLVVNDRESSRRTEIISSTNRNEVSAAAAEGDVALIPRAVA